MISEGTIFAVKKNFEEIYRAEGYVCIVCDKHNFHIDKDKIKSYKFDQYGISLSGVIPYSYQSYCTFNRVYIPIEAITALTGKGS